MQYHPDKVSADGRAEAAEKFKLISEAYQVLIDDGSRRNYDLERQQRKQFRGQRQPSFNQGPFMFSQNFIDPFQLFERMFAEMQQMHSMSFPAPFMFHPPPSMMSDLHRQDPFLSDPFFNSGLQSMGMGPGLMSMMMQPPLLQSMRSTTSGGNTVTSSTVRTNFISNGTSSASRSTYTETRNGRTVHVERETLPDGRTKEVRQEFLEGGIQGSGTNTRNNNSNHLIMSNGGTGNNNRRLVKRQVLIDGVDVSNESSPNTQETTDTSIPVRVLKK